MKYHSDLFEEPDPNDPEMLETEREFDRVTALIDDKVDSGEWGRHYPITKMARIELVIRMGREFWRWSFRTQLMMDDQLENAFAAADGYYFAAWNQWLELAREDNSGLEFIGWEEKRRVKRYPCN